MVVGLPRMPDGRAGVCSSAGVGAAPVNRQQQCQIWQSGGCARCCAHWGGFGAGNCIFWG